MGHTGDSDWVLVLRSGSRMSSLFPTIYGLLNLGLGTYIRIWLSMWSNVTESDPTGNLARELVFESKTILPVGLTRISYVWSHDLLRFLINSY